MDPTPLWLLPPNFSPSEQEGREAFRNGHPITRNRFGDSLAGTEWIKGWKAEQALASK